MDSLPDRTDWLDPNNDDEPLGTSQVEVEVSPPLIIISSLDCSFFNFIVMLI